MRARDLKAIRRWAACGLLAFMMSAQAATVRAEELHVMVSGAFTAAYKVLAADWEKATGNTVSTAYGASMGGTPTAIPNRLSRGEAADVVILARPALDALVRDGKVIDRSQVDLVRSRIGMAVRAGAKVPDISTEARFRQVLLDARSIAYSDSASGVYIANEMYQKLGLADRLAGKSKAIPGTPVGEVVARGEAQIGFQQMSELLPVQGITVVGPIPDSLQRVTVFSAGVATAARARAAARQFLEFLSSSQAWAVIRRAGLEPAAAAVEAR